MNKVEILNLFEFYDSGSGIYLNRSSFNEIEKVVDNILILHKLKTAELEAKVYTYEKIIANSNFKSINNKSIDSLNKKIKELEKGSDKNE